MKINSIKRLYHGTNCDFDKFDFKYARRFKDFGKGFYLTSSYAQAQKWAQSKANRSDTAYIYSYDRMADSRYREMSDMLQKYVEEGIAAETVIKRLIWDKSGIWRQIKEW